MKIRTEILAEAERLFSYGIVLRKYYEQKRSCWAAITHWLWGAISGERLSFSEKKTSSKTFERTLRNTVIVFWPKRKFSVCTRKQPLLEAGGLEETQRTCAVFMFRLSKGDSSSLVIMTLVRSDSAHLAFSFKRTATEHNAETRIRLGNMKGEREIILKMPSQRGQNKHCCLVHSHKCHVLMNWKLALFQSFANFFYLNILIWEMESSAFHFSHRKMNENSKKCRWVKTCIWKHLQNARDPRWNSFGTDGIFFFSPSHILAVWLPTICFAPPREQTWKTSVPRDAEISWNIHLLLAGYILLKCVDLKDAAPPPSNVKHVELLITLYTIQKGKCCTSMKLFNAD